MNDHKLMKKTDFVLEFVSRVSLASWQKVKKISLRRIVSGFHV